CQQDYTAPYSF
nr:immunoglobulin light chain junction region [Macaca mulatta]